MLAAKIVFLAAGAVCFFVGAIPLAPGPNWTNAGLGFVTLAALAFVLP